MSSTYTPYNNTHLLWFVTGSVRTYFEQMHQPVEGLAFDMYLHDTMHMVVMFLSGSLELNAQFSDHQCVVASAAKKYFG